ncbi:nuclear transport factor 2 family protein [Streptomyces sp. NPDC127106]|uniref:nuclear transport factor 2 family protein n=1 Tax=Streptomyces sp. NPDC127106 TaxID=3345360 RepID=UPI00363484F9
MRLSGTAVLQWSADGSSHDEGGTDQRVRCHIGGVVDGSAAPGPARTASGAPPTAQEGPTTMNEPPPEPNGRTRLAHILGVPLAPEVERQWPQMGEVVHGSRLIGEIEANFPGLALGVGRRLRLDDDVIVVEWTCDYGDGRLYRNVTIAELREGRAVRVTDYWGEPTTTPPWRLPLTARLDMPGDGIWKDHRHLGHH